MKTFFLFLTLSTVQLVAGDALEIFTHECRTKAQAASEAGQRAIMGEDDWLFLNSEVDHLATPLTAENIAPSISAITATQKALAAKNIQLIVVPVPAKAEMVAHKLFKKGHPMAIAGRAKIWFDALEAAGVNAIDLAVTYRDTAKFDGLAALYCQRDAHWSPAGASLAADAIFAAFDSKDLQGDVACEFGQETTLKISGDLLEEDHIRKLGPETIKIIPVGLKKDGKIEPLAAAPNSPILLLGDSHTLVFTEGASAGFHCQGAGLLDHLQQRFARPIDLIASPASGADNARMQLARKAASDPAYLSGKKLVIWCFAMREITESKWKEIPLAQ